MKGLANNGHVHILVLLRAKQFRSVADKNLDLVEARVQRSVGVASITPLRIDE